MEDISAKDSERMRWPQLNAGPGGNRVRSDSPRPNAGSAREASLLGDSDRLRAVGRRVNERGNRRTVERGREERRNKRNGRSRGLHLSVTTMISRGVAFVFQTRQGLHHPVSADRFRERAVECRSPSTDGFYWSLLRGSSSTGMLEQRPRGSRRSCSSSMGLNRFWWLSVDETGLEFIWNHYASLGRRIGYTWTTYSRAIKIALYWIYQPFLVRVQFSLRLKKESIFQEFFGVN